MKSRQIVFDIHRLKNEGVSTRRIAEMLGIGRNTVIRYLKNPDKTLTSRIAPVSKLDPHKDLIAQMLEQDPSVSATVILRQIKEHGYDGEITILRGYLRQTRGTNKAKQAYIRVESKPGEEIQIDWADFGSIPYGDTMRRVYALVAVESYSRMMYVEFTHSMKQAALHYCLLNAFKYFCGTPQSILVDNMTTAVIERQGQLIRFNDAFLDFLRPLKITPKACNPRSPNEKGKVERAIRYLRGNFIPLTTFDDLADYQNKVQIWLDQTANVRVQQTTGKTPKERFSKVSLRALPQLIPQALETVMVVVHKDFSVKFDANSYTTPPWTI